MLKTFRPAAVVVFTTLLAGHAFARPVDVPGVSWDPNGSLVVDPQEVLHVSVGVSREVWHADGRVDSYDVPTVGLQIATDLAADPVTLGSMAAEPLPPEEWVAERLVATVLCDECAAPVDTAFWRYYHWMDGVHELVSEGDYSAGISPSLYRTDELGRTFFEQEGDLRVEHSVPDLDIDTFPVVEAIIGATPALVEGGE